MLRENSQTRRAFWRVFRKTEDAGIPAYVKDDNAAKDVSERPAGMCALVKRRYSDSASLSAAARLTAMEYWPIAPAL